MTDSTIRHEVEVDTRIAAALDKFLVQSRRADSMLRHLDSVEERVAKMRGPLTESAAARAASEILIAREQFEAEAVKYRAAYAAYATVAEEYEGWTRFYLVRASNGHIHSSMSCSTCYASTDYGWLVDVSGLTEAEAVAAHGERLCTVCYPTAPSAWTAADAYYRREAASMRDAKVAERAAKADAKAARIAKRRETVCYGLRLIREDGSIYERFRDYRNEIDWSYGAKSLATAKRDARESTAPGYGRYEVVNLHTLEVVE